MTMMQLKAIKLAQLIILVDLFRDELYEELLKRHGNQANEILRAVQNELI
jgi:hypothetical protein